MEALFYLSDLLATVLLMWWAVKKNSGGSDLAIFRLLDFKENLEKPTVKATEPRVTLGGRSLPAAGEQAGMAWRDTGWSKARKPGAKGRRTPAR
jgi:hypothetical protein